ncbi:hypothetical protein EsDP_00005262 [Epichloe bromicola]|uniref:Xylanolytic transcriptional activator regulatory domain-containing protein n=1 Tax=Epichloe bromicola TaxID=79588 RepID=A0ABQ0CU57_9HYPO
MADSLPAAEVLSAKTTCSRCVGSSLENECVCVASQRGQEASRRRRQTRHSECPRRNDVVDSQDEEESGGSGNEDAGTEAFFQEAPSPWTRGTHASSVECSAERCISSFYHYFFASHPFVLPQEQLKRVMAERKDEVQPLRAAMAWIGSLYLPVSPVFRDEAYEKARREMAVGRVRRRGFFLQAMMLLVLGLDGCDRRGEATAALRDAEHLALEIGLNKRHFASLYGFDTRAVEESWRRTWWELYVVDAMMAGVRRASDFVLCDAGADVALPCEEHDYVSDCIPASRVYIEDVENQDMSQDKSHSLSSFAHRILSARILGASRSFDPRHEHEHVDRTERLLTAWRLGLPHEKQASLCPDGSPDEMMFQANMISHATSILLHQPLSVLDSSSPAGDVTSCGCGTSHTRHVVESAAAISNMITHRVPLISHSHFFSCIVSLSAVVHLSQWAPLASGADERVRQLVRLHIAALHGLSAVWRAAGRAREQVQAVAQEIYRARKGRTESRQEQLKF